MFGLDEEEEDFKGELGFLFFVVSKSLLNQLQTPPHFFHCSSTYVLSRSVAGTTSLTKLSWYSVKVETTFLYDDLEMRFFDSLGSFLRSISQLVDEYQTSRVVVFWLGLGLDLMDMYISNRLPSSDWLLVPSRPPFHPSLCPDTNTTAIKTTANKNMAKCSDVTPRPHSQHTTIAQQLKSSNQHRRFDDQI